MTSQESAARQEAREFLKITILSRAYLLVNRRVIELLGLNCAIYIEGLLFRESQLMDELGWFTVPIPTIQKDTGMSRKTQRSVREKLRKLGLLEVRRTGTPPQYRYRFNHDKLQEMLWASVKQPNNPAKGETPDITQKGLMAPLGENPEQGETPDITQKGLMAPLDHHIYTGNNIDPGGNLTVTTGGISSPRRRKPLKKIQTKKERRALVKGVKPRLDPPKVKKVSVPPQYRTIMTLWGQVAIQHKDNTKVLKESLSKLQRLLAGTLFKDTELEEHNRAFTQKEIMKAIGIFDVRRNSLAYLPKNKEFLKRLSFGDFLYNPRSTAKMKSVFLECLLYGAKKMDTLNNYPKLNDPVAARFLAETGMVLEGEELHRVCNRIGALWKNHTWKGIRSPDALFVHFVLYLNDQEGDGRWDSRNFLYETTRTRFLAHMAREGHLPRTPRRLAKERLGRRTD